MKRPAFQFYPGDWRANAKLRRCSWAARGAWVEIICLLHDSEEYGILRWTLEEIALAVGCPLECVNELTLKGVLKGTPKGGFSEGLVYTPRTGRKLGEPVVLIPAQEGDIWFSSRMVEDEYVRQRRAKCGIDGYKTTQDTTTDNSPKPPFGEADAHPLGAPPSSSSSSPFNNNISEAEELKKIIEVVREVAPQLVHNKPDAIFAWLRSGADANEDIIPAIRSVCANPPAGGIYGFGIFTPSVEKAKAAREEKNPSPVVLSKNPMVRSLQEIFIARFGAPHYNSWIANLQEKTVSENAIIFVSKSKFNCEWVKNNYLDFLQESARKVGVQKIEVVLEN